MTEAEWLAASDPDPTLAFFDATVSHRKLRLFAVACCRRQPAANEAWDCWENAAEVAEAFCDGRADSAAMDRAQANVESRLELYPGEPVYNAGFWACGRDIVRDVIGAAFYSANLIASSQVEFSSRDHDDRYAAVREVERRCQCVILRDIFGNPFRPVTFSPSWLTTTAVGLAEAIYADRAFDRLPILADALQDAGCEDEAILAHCRGDGPHVRGCWVVDGVLGKG
ncbi:hypothetical protein [Limnoglobus roseus]|uniref:SMI1/KNR4 family protein n=1 Tax=Limnoglobus roseus TaxID=2598579 RepID=A0A5C1AN47_9BACT|nr:hypothetical protein [Limnoglobus roseus]QEL18634.1 hypothetical protein PX52LOC_05667 [Limnoglobus roseus]